MAQYQVTLDGDVLPRLFQGDEGIARLLEQVLNQILQAQATEQLQAGPVDAVRETSGLETTERCPIP